MPRAPRRCPGDDYTCTATIKPGQHHCPQHQRTWADTPRTASSQITSSHAWRKLAPKILTRDLHHCRLQYPCCIRHATVVDHKIPAHARPDLALRPENLQAACKPCNDHKARTADKQETR